MRVSLERKRDKVTKNLRHTTVLVRYRSGNTQEYTYKAPKSLKLKPGDIVLVPAVENFVLASVTFVHKKPMYDTRCTAADFNIKWVVCKVDFTPYYAALDVDAAYETKIEASSNTSTKRRYFDDHD